MNDIPEGRALDRAIAELMGWTGFTLAEDGWIGRDPEDGHTCYAPDFTESLDALQAPEQVLRDAGWRLTVLVVDGGARAGWLSPWESAVYPRWLDAPAEPAARAAAVYAGLLANKEADGG